MPDSPLDAERGGVAVPATPGPPSFADAFVEEVEALAGANWSADAIGSVVRIRALRELSEIADADMLMKLAFVASRRPVLLKALLEAGAAEARSQLIDTEH